MLSVAVSFILAKVQLWTNQAGQLSKPEQKATVATQGLPVVVLAAPSSASSDTSLVKISSSISWMVVSVIAFPLSLADAVGSD